LTCVGYVGAKEHVRYSGWFGGPFRLDESGMKVLSSCRDEGVFTDWRLR
jgi:hypothetical protein